MEATIAQLRSVNGIRELRAVGVYRVQAELVIWTEHEKSELKSLRADGGRRQQRLQQQ